MLYPRREGNLVLPLVDGEAFFARLQAAVRAATASVCVIVSFIDRDFLFADGESFWDLMLSAGRRGVRVRLLFWRNQGFFRQSTLFNGLPEDLAFLETIDPGRRLLRCRFDPSPYPEHCHHQKTMVVDAGVAGETSFVGGMTFNSQMLDSGAHAREAGSIHDSFLEVRGPAASDVAHNFVQRWNACAGGEGDDVPWPLPLAPPQGASVVQLARTLAPNVYRDSLPPAGCDAAPADVALGEEDILLQYREALAGAQRSIYIENQHPGELSLLRLLREALERGVVVSYLLPSIPMLAVSDAKLAADADPSSRHGELFAELARLGRHPGFTLAALAVEGRQVYTHSKLCIVDGEWLTCGSANLVYLSLDKDHTELNAAVWDREVAVPLLRQLVAEHVGRAERDLAALDDAQLVRLFSAACLSGAPKCHCHALDPEAYPRRRGRPQLPLPLLPAEQGAWAPHLRTRKLETALLLAVRAGNAELALDLLRRGAWPGARDASGSSVLGAALQRGDERTALLLMSRSAAFAPPGAGNDAGETELHAACRGGSPLLVLQLLLSARVADPLRRNARGQRPRDVASSAAVTDLLDALAAPCVSSPSSSLCSVSGLRALHAQLTWGARPAAEGLLAEAIAQDAAPAVALLLAAGVPVPVSAVAATGLVGDMLELQKIL